MDVFYCVRQYGGDERRRVKGRNPGQDFIGIVWIRRVVYLGAWREDRFKNCGDVVAGVFTSRMLGKRGHEAQQDGGDQDEAPHDDTSDYNDL